MNRRLLLSTAALSFAIVASVVWWQAGRVPELASPLTVTKTSALSDGGSLHVELMDARGARFAFGVTGALKIPREQFPVYVLRWAPAPLVRHIERGSKEEQQLAVLARRAAADNISNLGYAMFLLQVAEVLEARPGGPT